MRSLLYQTGATTLRPSSRCTALPVRTEVPISVRKDGRVYNLVVRDKLAPEDLYLTMVRAISFAVRMNEPYAGQSPARDTRDFLIKRNVVPV